MRSIREVAENILGGDSSAHAFIIEGRPQKARSRLIEDLITELGCHPMDIVHMHMSGKAAYKVEDASAFCERLEMGAYGRVLAGIIDDADALSEVVQNKLLKTLEEPRGPVIILLGSSNREYLLETVRSRCSVIRLQDHAGEGYDEEDAEPEDIRSAAGLITDGAEFHIFRDALENSVKTKGDALMLIDILEDGLRERMMRGESMEALADCIETAERARMDIERDMDKNKALKRLFLELSGN